MTVCPSQLSGFCCSSCSHRQSCLRFWDDRFFHIFYNLLVSPLVCHGGTLINLFIVDFLLRAFPFETLYILCKRTISRVFMSTFYMPQYYYLCTSHRAIHLLLFFFLSFIFYHSVTFDLL